jgi:protein ImuB
LFRALKAKLEALELAAPVTRLSIELSRIVPAPEIQLDLARNASVSPDALPALLAELAAELDDAPGASPARAVRRVGVLQIGDDHRPEHRGRLVSIDEAEAEWSRRRRGSRTAQLALFAAPAEPPRLLPTPVPLGLRVGGQGPRSRLVVGATIFVGRESFEVVHLRFDRRLDGVGWWTSSSADRDYLRAVLAMRSRRGVPDPRAREPRAPDPRAREPRSWDRDASNDGEPSRLAGGATLEAASFTEAWIYVDRTTGEAFLQGYWE